MMTTQLCITLAVLVSIQESLGGFTVLNNTDINGFNLNGAPMVFKVVCICCAFFDLLWCSGTKRPWIEFPLTSA